jgi:hypothetical protein
MRKAKNCTIDELRQVMINFSPDDDDKYPLFFEDIGKVQFDFENFSRTNFPCDKFTDSLSEGFYHIDGLTFLLYMAGGDWEIPVFFIAYLDPNNKVRGYIPKDGNTWNLKTKQASTAEDEIEGRELDKTLFIDDILKRIEVVK